MNPHVAEFLSGARKLREQLEAAINGVEAFFETDKTTAPLSPEDSRQTENASPAKRTYKKWGGQREAAPVRAAVVKTRKTKAVASPGQSGGVTTAATRAFVPHDGDPLNKPKTVGGAMKLLARQWGTFTRGEMKAALESDRDWSKLIADNPQPFSDNLIYWSTSGKLKRTDGESQAADSFTVMDKLWFEKA
jgi:hypothetical protein